MVSGGGIERKQRREKDHKGFTLVELIVVIVILAILAAILIPGLLKWIDEAKKKQYELEARNIYLAAEAELIKLYGQDETSRGFDSIHDSEIVEKVKKLSGIENILVLEIQFDGAGKEINRFQVDFQSSDGKYIVAMKGPEDQWKIGEYQTMPSWWQSTP